MKIDTEKWGEFKLENYFEKCNLKCLKKDWSGII